MTAPSTPPLYGVLAEFASADHLLAAARRVRAAGYSRAEAYAPFDVEGLAEALGFERSSVPLFTFCGALLGGLGGYFMQWYAAVIDYPVDIGGRPLHSWPMFMPVTFELTVLVASLAVVLGMLAMNGLPRPHHPLFAMPGFDLATRDRFFLCIESRDPRFDRGRTREFLARLGPHAPREVPL